MERRRGEVSRDARFGKRVEIGGRANFLLLRVFFFYIIRYLKNFRFDSKISYRMIDFSNFNLERDDREGMKFRRRLN